MYKDISKMRPAELGSYVGDIAIELRNENPGLSNGELIELAFKKIREESQGVRE
ncbi:TPA: hypothetical protein ACKOR7_003011 [Clostridioides difficile]